jgi:ATP-dependent protease ClpP protease subunit
MAAWRIVEELFELWDAEAEYQAGRRKIMWQARHRWSSPPPELWTSLGDNVDDAAANRIAAVLDTAPDAPVHISVESDGGNPLAAFRIYQTLRAHPGPITAFTAQRCHSAAIIAYLGADIRLAAPEAAMLVHGCARLPADRASARELRGIAEELEDIDRRIVDVIACRAGRYPHWRLRADMARETVLDGHAARNNGIVTQLARS